VQRAWARPAAVGAAFVLGIALSAWLNSLSTPHASGAASVDDGRLARQQAFSRILCMSPAVVEIVYAIGAGEDVAGITEHVKYPPEALGKPECGGYFNPNLERIIALQPDLIVTQGEAGKLARFARDNGVRLISLQLTDLESILRETLRLGRLLGRSAQAELLCAELRLRLARVKAAVAERPRLKVAMIAWRDPGTLTDISVVGSGGFLGDLIDVAGGVNVFGDLAREFEIVSKEAILERMPDVVVELHGEGGDEAALQNEVRRLWDGLPSLPAVRDGRVYAVESTYAMIPGPRVVQLAERLAGLFAQEGDQ